MFVIQWPLSYNLWGLTLNELQKQHHSLTLIWHAFDCIIIWFIETDQPCTFYCSQSLWCQPRAATIYHHWRHCNGNSEWRYDFQNCKQRLLWRIWTSCNRISRTEHLFQVWQFVGMHHSASVNLDTAAKSQANIYNLDGTLLMQLLHRFCHAHLSLVLLFIELFSAENNFIFCLQFLSSLWNCSSSTSNIWWNRIILFSAALELKQPYNCLRSNVIFNQS